MLLYCLTNEIYPYFLVTFPVLKSLLFLPKSVTPCIYMLLFFVTYFICIVSCLPNGSCGCEISVSVKNLCMQGVRIPHWCMIAILLDGWLFDWWVTQQWMGWVLGLDISRGIYFIGLNQWANMYAVQRFFFSTVPSIVKVCC